MTAVLIEHQGKSQDFNSESCGVLAESSFLGRWRGQGHVWRCLLAYWTTGNTFPLETWSFLWSELYVVDWESGKGDMKKDCESQEGQTGCFVIYQNKFKKQNSKQIKILKTTFGKGDDAARHKQKQQLVDDIHKCTMTTIKMRDLWKLSISYGLLRHTLLIWVASSVNIKSPDDMLFWILVRTVYPIITMAFASVIFGYQSMDE